MHQQIKEVVWRFEVLARCFGDGPSRIERYLEFCRQRLTAFHHPRFSHLFGQLESKWHVAQLGDNIWPSCGRLTGAVKQHS